jgi:hypothetical protein
MPTNPVKFIFGVLFDGWELIRSGMLPSRILCAFRGHSPEYGGCCSWCLKGLDGED